MRALLLRMNDGEHSLLLVAHRIICDRWSWQAIFAQLTTLYQAIAQGATLPASPVSVEYADYARAHRRWLLGGVLEADLDYWKLQLGSTFPSLDLNPDRKPTTGQERGRHSLKLSAQLSAALRELSEREGVDLSTTLLAAFQTLLQLYTGQDEIAVGTVIKNREQ